MAWSLFSDSAAETTEEAAVAVRRMEGRSGRAGLSFVGQAQSVGGHVQEVDLPEFETLPSGAPSSFGDVDSSFLHRIESFQNQNQGSGRTVIPNAFAWSSTTSTSNPTYIVDTSGQRIESSHQQDLEPLFGSHHAEAAFNAAKRDAAAKDAQIEALTQTLETRGANPFAPVVKPSNPTYVEMPEGFFDPDEQIQQNPLGTGSDLSQNDEFDYSTIGDNPFRPALENLPENGETPLESFQIRRKASALYVFSGLWDTIDALVHPVRTFHQTQELIQTLIYLPDYCYHNSEVCQTNMLAGLFTTMDYVHRFETGQLHLSDKQMGVLEGAAIELVLPGPEDSVLDLAKLSSKVDNALDAVDNPTVHSDAPEPSSNHLDEKVEESAPFNNPDFDDTEALRLGRLSPDEFPDLVFRGSQSEPSVKLEQGFTPRGENHDLFGHAMGEISDSAFVSTSTAAEVGAIFSAIRGDVDGYLYAIQPATNVPSYDVNRAFSDGSSIGWEDEIAIRGPVLPEQIVGYWKIDSKSKRPIGDFVSE